MESAVDDATTGIFLELYSMIAFIDAELVTGSFIGLTKKGLMQYHLIKIFLFL